MSGRPSLLRPDRLRTIEKPFGWIPFRLLTDGFFADLSDRSKLLYVFLCLVADRQGTSFYGDAKLQTYFQLHQAKIDLARTELIHKDLIAYDGRRYQVLSLPGAEHREPRRTKTAPEHRTADPERLGDILQRLVRDAR
jgi:hypothetical protein